MFCVGFFITFFLYPKGIDGISVYIFQRMWKGGEIMNTSSFEHIVRIQFNALMIKNPKFQAGKTVPRNHFTGGR